MAPVPVAVTLIALKVPLIHCVCVAGNWLLIAVAAFVINAPETAVVAVPQVPVTTQ